MIKHTVNPDGTVSNVQIINESVKKDNYCTLYDIAEKVKGTMNQVRAVRYKVKAIPAYKDINNKHYFDIESQNKILEMYYEMYHPDGLIKLYSVNENKCKYKQETKQQEENNSVISTIEVIRTKINGKVCLFFKSNDGKTYVATEWQELGL